MPRVCTICSHPNRTEVDRMLVSRSASFRDIARRFGVGKDAVSRHTKEHLPELLAKAHSAEETAQADELLMDIRELQERTLLTLTNAEKAGDLRTVLSAVAQARQNIALLAEMRGELDRRPQVNIVFTPEWVAIRTAMMEALECYAEARAAVSGKLLELEGGDGSPG